MRNRKKLRSLSVCMYTEIFRRSKIGKNSCTYVCIEDKKTKLLKKEGAE